jgi:hypothetical protein
MSDMLFDYGTTRFVLCIGDVVIKIPRIKVIYWINRLWLWKKNGEIVQKFSTVGSTKRLSALKHLFAGVTANLEEVRFYRKYPHLPLAPTLFSFLGLINIQTRAKLIEKEDLVLCPFRQLAKGQERLGPVDLNKPENFGRIGGAIYLLDYGNKELNILLDEVASSLQVAYEF